MTRQILDVTLPNRNKRLSIVPQQEYVRVYASSLYDNEGPLVSVVLLNELGVITTGLRINRADARQLYVALGDFLVATSQITANREE